MFVNLWGQPHGYPLAYPAVYDVVRWLRRRTGIGFDPHLVPAHRGDPDAA